MEKKAFSKAEKRSKELAGHKKKLLGFLREPRVAQIEICRELRFKSQSDRRTVKRFPGRSPTVDQVCTFPHPSFQMAKSVAKYSIMTQEMVDSFCEAFYIPAGVHPTAPGRDKTIIQFPAEKDSAPLITVRQEETVRLLESHKAPFHRYLKCFLCQVGLSKYYPFDDNSYPAYEYGFVGFHSDCWPSEGPSGRGSEGADQVTLLKSIKDCFMPLVIPAAGGSSSAAAADVLVPTEERQEDVAPEDAYLNLADPDEDAIVVRQGEERVVSKQPKKVKRRRLVKPSDALPAKKLRTDHPSLASGTGGKTLANLDSGTLSAPVDIAVAATTSTRPATASKAAADVGPSHPEESKSSDDSFYDIPNVDLAMAKRWYVPKWNITNDSLLDDAFSSRKICLGSEVRSRIEHELELKEKLRAKYAARGKLLEDRDLEILDLKSKLTEKETEAAEAIRLRDQVSSLSGEKSDLTAEVSALKVTIAQKDHDISLLDSHATSLASGLENAKVACTEAGDKIISLTSERDRLISEVSSLHAGFQDFKKKMEVQQEEQPQELYNRVAELEAHVMDVFGRLEGEFYPTYLTTLAGRRWLLAHEVQLALLKCLKSSEYQGILGHALGRAVDFGMQAGLEAGHEHGSAGRSLSVVDAYNPEAAKANYIDAVKALEDVDFPLVNLLKSKKDAGMDEVLDCFLLDGPAADLPEAVHLQPCLEQLTVPIHHAGDKTIVGETSLSFALMNVHSRAEGAKKHAAALRKLMIDIVSDPLSSQTWVGEASTSAAPLSVEDYQEEDTDEALGSVVAIPQLEAPYL
ncbi:hypothetical protein Tco_1538522 [Tanacetum coccineum]